MPAIGTGGPVETFPGPSFRSKDMKGCGWIIFLLALMFLAPFLPIILSLLLLGLALAVGGVLAAVAAYAAWKRLSSTP